MAWTNILDVIYPVGSIYMSTVNVSPASTIGGSWAQITGRFIKADTTPSSTGGSDTHTHTYGADWLSYYGTIVNFNQDGFESYLGLWDERLNAFNGGDRQVLTTMSGVTNSSIATNIQNIGSAYHMGATATLMADNSPAYYTVCMWVRTA